MISARRRYPVPEPGPPRTQEGAILRAEEAAHERHNARADWYLVRLATIAGRGDVLVHSQIGGTEWRWIDKEKSCARRMHRPPRAEELQDQNRISVVMSYEAADAVICAELGERLPERLRPSGV